METLCPLRHALCTLSFIPKSEIQNPKSPYSLSRIKYWIVTLSLDPGAIVREAGFRAKVAVSSPLPFKLSRSTFSVYTVTIFSRMRLPPTTSTVSGSDTESTRINCSGSLPAQSIWTGSFFLMVSSIKTAISFGVASRKIIPGGREMFSDLTETNWDR
jgi:hypothetical protein